MQGKKSFTKKQINTPVKWTSLQLVFIHSWNSCQGLQQFVTALL